MKPYIKFIAESPTSTAFRATYANDANAYDRKTLRINTSRTPMFGGWLEATRTAEEAPLDRGEFLRYHLTKLELVGG